MGCTDVQIVGLLIDKRGGGLRVTDRPTDRPTEWSRVEGVGRPRAVGCWLWPNMQIHIFTLMAIDMLGVVGAPGHGLSIIEFWTLKTVFKTK